MGATELTPRQKKYCRERANGKTRKDAYIAAGYSPSDAAKSGYLLEKGRAISPLIQKEIARLQAMADKGAVLNRKARQALLTEIALDETEKTDNKLRSIDMLNRMAGDYTDRIEQTGTVTLMSYEERKQMLLESLKEEG